MFNPRNPYVLRGHIYCAAVEKPLSDRDVAAFGAQEVVDELTAEGFLRRRPRGWFPAPLRDAPLTHDTAHSSVNLRGGSGQEVMIVDVSDGRLLGTVDAARAAAQVHPGAVYLRQGESFVVEELDFDDHIALARPELPDYSTVARSTTDIRILDSPGGDELVNYSPGLWAANVEVEVTDRVTGYLVTLADGSSSDLVPLDMPEQRLRTRAVAYTVDPLALEAKHLLYFPR